MSPPKKLGMLGKALRGLGRTNRATGVTPIQAKKNRAKTKAPVNKNKKAVQKRVKPKTSKAKAAAQKAAIRKKVAAKVSAAKKKSKK